MADPCTRSSTSIDGPSDRGLRARALAFSLVVIAAMIWPALREQPYDSFPLSTYPMFSSKRDTAWIHVVVGFDERGNEHRIGPRLVANAEVMQAAQTIQQAIRRKQAPALCERVARAVALTPELDALVRLEVQSRRFDPRTYFVTEAGRTPLELRRRARCAVPREGA